MTFDVIGVGALNIDFVASGAAAAAHLGTVERGTETAVGSAQLTAALTALGTTAVAQPGGSAFNTLHALAGYRPGLRLGFVGVAGRPPVPALTPFAALSARHVDVSGVLISDLLSGTCLAVTVDGERTLLTYGGANQLLAGYVADRFTELAAHLAQARLIHVTSFLDSVSAAALGTLLGEVRDRNPAAIVSFDPGHVWCTMPPAGFEELLRLSGLLFVNRRELAALAGPGALTDEVRAAMVLRRLAVGALIVVKRPDGTSVYTAGSARHFDHPVLPAAQIAGATGAGDVFAAGFLAEYLAEPADVRRAARAGAELARRLLVGSGVPHT